MNTEVAQFFKGLKQWKNELTLLRNIIMTTGVEETYKWKHPCYTHNNNNNIVLIHGFKNYCAISFFKGALLKDKKQILVQPTDNTQSGRQLRFESKEEILALEKTIVQYIKEAILVEDKGLKVEFKKTEAFDMPESVTKAFKKSPALREAFYKLTPGRQRAYLLYFAEAKQVATQETRIEKYTGRILNGKGINDCVCGLSKRMPNCDGSHKQLATK